MIPGAKVSIQLLENGGYYEGIFLEQISPYVCRVRIGEHDFQVQTERIYGEKSWRRQSRKDHERIQGGDAAQWQQERSPGKEPKASDRDRTESAAPGEQNKEQSCLEHDGPFYGPSNAR